MKSAALTERAPENVLFVGSLNLHNAGVYRLTTDYAASHGMRLFHTEGGNGSCITHVCRYSLIVCSPPCGAGIRDWLAALLAASQCSSDRVVVYLDSLCPVWRQSLIPKLFSCPHGVVYDSDTSVCIERTFSRSLPVYELTSPSGRLTDREVAVLRGYLRGISVQAQASGFGESVKSIYRLRLSGLSKLGLWPRMHLAKPSP